MTKHVLAAFAVPPGILVLAAAVLGVLFLRGKRSAAGFAFLLFGVLLWAVSLPPAAERMFQGLEAPYEQLPAPKGDVIVLLGGGLNDGAPDLTGTGTLSGEMLARVVTAARLQKMLSVPILVSGGNAFRGRPPEAPVVKRFLVDLGIPGDKILLEGESRDTRENAILSAAILRSRGYAKPVLVTSAFHMKRAVLLFRRAGVEVAPYPAGFHSWTGMKHGFQDFLPTASAMHGFAIAAREYLGLLYYGNFP